MEIIIWNTHSNIKSWKQINSKISSYGSPVACVGQYLPLAQSNMNPLVKKKIRSRISNSQYQPLGSLQTLCPGNYEPIYSLQILFYFHFPILINWRPKNYKQKQRLYNKAKTFKIQADCTLFMKFCKATQKKIQSQYRKYRAHIILLKQDKEQIIWHNIKSINKGSNKDTIGISPLKDFIQIQNPMQTFFHITIPTIQIRVI